MTNTLGYLLRLPKFQHLEASTVHKACSLLSRYKGEAKLVAGGTDLLVCMKQRDIQPGYLVNIKGISGLDGISFDGKVLSIGALATINDIESSPVIREKFHVLASAAHNMCTP